MEPILARKQGLKGVQHILVVAALIHVAIFIDQCRETFAALMDREPVASGACVGGLDGRGYYAWLRCPLIDGDFHFENDYAQLGRESLASQASWPLSPIGRRSNQWPVGPAIAWAPAVVTLHLVLSSLGSDSPWPTDGFSPPYQLAVGLTTLALGIVTLVLMYKIGGFFCSPPAAATGAALVALGTPVVAYGAVDVCMAHGPATAALTLFVFFWLRTFGSTRTWRWAVLGSLLGLTSLMRWQLGTFALLPALEAIWLATNASSWSHRGEIAIHLALAGLMSVVVFIPQLLVKQIVYGHPLGGLHQTAHNWLEPSLWEVLCSTNRGLFYWTPITLPAIAGLAYLAWRTKRPDVAILTVAVSVQIWTISALIGIGVGLGSSFGFRMLTETCALTAPGLAVLFDRVGPRTFRCLSLSGGLLVLWNLLLLGVYRYYLGVVEGGDVSAMWACVTHYVHRRPLEGLGILAAVGWLTYALAVASGDDAEPVIHTASEQMRRRLAG